MTPLEKYVAIDHEIKRLEARKKELRADIGELEVGGANVADDNYRVSVSNTRKFSPVLAKKLLSEEDFKRILKVSPDVNLAKRIVSPEKLDEMYEVTGQTWKVIERDDR